MDTDYIKRSELRIRDADPPLTIYWLAQRATNIRGVPLRYIFCLFCQRTLVADFKGEIQSIINAPVNADEFSQILTIRCKSCKQNYRLAVVENLQG